MAQRGSRRGESGVGYGSPYGKGTPANKTRPGKASSDSAARLRRLSRKAATKPGTSTRKTVR